MLAWVPYREQVRKDERGKKDTTIEEKRERE
jgi:hypothetical protein